METIQNFGYQQQPGTIGVLFQDICEFVRNREKTIKHAANLDGGWEGWLQAALAVHLNELANSSKYIVEREAKVYDQGAEAQAAYKQLRGLARADKMGSTGKLRADLAVKTTTDNQHIVIELKCESIGMSKLAKLIVNDESPATKARRDEITSNYITLGVTHDAMKLHLGFDTEKGVNRACICAVTFSDAAGKQLGYLKGQGYEYLVPGTTIKVFMWHVAIQDGKWRDDGHAPDTLIELKKFLEAEAVVEADMNNQDMAEDAKDAIYAE